MGLFWVASDARFSELDIFQAMKIFMFFKSIDKIYTSCYLCWTFGKSKRAAVFIHNKVLELQTQALCKIT